MANINKSAQYRGTITISDIARSELTQESQIEYAVPLTMCRVHDAMSTLLPTSAANDDMAIITGTPGTDATTLQGVDFGGTTTDEKCAFEFVLPPEYVSGGQITVRVRGSVIVMSDGTATVDVECWCADDDGGVSADLCTTAAQSINSTSPADKNFTITATGRQAGDRLIIRVSFAGTDAGNAAPNITCEIQKLSVLLNIQG